MSSYKSVPRPVSPHLLVACQDTSCATHCTATTACDPDMLCYLSSAKLAAAEGDSTSESKLQTRKLYLILFYEGVVGGLLI